MRRKKFFRIICLAVLLLAAFVFLTCHQENLIAILKGDVTRFGYAMFGKQPFGY